MFSSPGPSSPPPAPVRSTFREALDYIMENEEEMDPDADFVLASSLRLENPNPPAPSGYLQTTSYDGWCIKKFVQTGHQVPTWHRAPVGNKGYYLILNPDLSRCNFLVDGAFVKLRYSALLKANTLVFVAPIDDEVDALTLHRGP